MVGRKKGMRGGKLDGVTKQPTRCTSKSRHVIVVLLDSSNHIDQLISIIGTNSCKPRQFPGSNSMSSFTLLLFTNENNCLVREGT